MKLGNRRKTALAVLLALAAQTGWAQQKFAIQGFDISGNTLLPAETAQAAVAGFLGGDRNISDLDKASEALKQAFVDAGYPVVQVYAPEQTVTSGQIKLRVIEGKVSKVTVAGNEAYDEANIRASLPPLQEGAAPNAAQIVSAIVLANENPAKQVAVNFQSGSNSGDVDAVINVTEDRVEKFTINYDNSGTEATGFNRLGVTYQNANIGNLDHMLTVGINTTLEHLWPLHRDINLIAGYRIPFYEYGLSLDLIGSYSDSRTTTGMPGGGGELIFTGRGTYAGVRLNQALPSVGELRHKVVYGIDYKDFANKCDTGGTATDCNTVTARPVSIAYVAQMATQEFQAGLNLSYNFNFAGGMHGSQDHYEAARSDAPRHWDAWRGSAFVAVPLPEDFIFRASASFQEASKKLVPSEQFGIGGASSVRGYAERAVAGDHGFVANLELYSPDFGSFLDENIKARGLVFLDHGSVRNNEDSAMPVDLKSIGLGLRLNYGKDLSFKADVGFSLSEAAERNGSPIVTMPHRQAWGLKPDNDHWGLHLSATYSF